MPSKTSLTLRCRMVASSTSRISSNVRPRSEAAPYAIRTSGEMRLSNFLLWQVAYAEIYVTEHLWPEFRGRHLLEAIASYQKRERRYGGLIDNGGGN